MKTTLLLSRDAQLVCRHAVSALLAMRMELDRHGFACAVERVAGGTVIYSSVAARFESIRWSIAG